MEKPTTIRKFATDIPAHRQRGSHHELDLKSLQPHYEGTPVALC